LLSVFICRLNAYINARIAMRDRARRAPTRLLGGPSLGDRA